MASEYGKRGGTSTNAGKKASTYEAVLPDGRKVTKKSFHVHQDVALLGCFQLNGVWRFSGIAPDAATIEAWGQRFVEARRIA